VFQLRQACCFRNKVLPALFEVVQALKGVVMAIEITSSSPQALTHAQEALNVEAKYPFDKLQPGQSFTVPFKECPKWKALRTNVYARNSRAAAKGTNVQFKFIKHDDLELIEVARIS
jgi:hypothetical protein